MQKEELIKLSVSKSGTFKSCKKKYQYSYILKFPKKEFSYHVFGRFAHRILELFHLKYLNGETNSHAKTMGLAFDEAMAEFTGKITSEFKTEAMDIMRIYLRRIKINKLENVSNVVSVEKVFNLQISESITLTGMIDRVQIDEDGIIHIADYKTSKSAKYLKDDTIQLLTYAYVLLQENPDIKKVRVSYIMLRLNCDWITKEFSLEDILKVKDTYQKYADDMRNEKDFPANPSVLCNFCEFSDSCSEGKEIVAKQYQRGVTKSWNQNLHQSKIKKD